jgi:hypothetical protein
MAPSTVADIAWLTATGSGGPLLHAAAAGSKTSTVATVFPSPVYPPMTRIRPSPPTAAVTSVRGVGAAARRCHVSEGAAVVDGGAVVGAGAVHPTSTRAAPSKPMRRRIEVVSPAQWRAR